MNLNDRALLVQLSISQWTARKKDKRATQEVAHINHATSSSVGNYHKKLLPTSDKLDAVHSKSNLIRQAFYTNTLPWGVEGMQILPSANYLAFMTDFRTHKAEWRGLVTDFLLDYDRVASEARRVLGNLFDPADYPSREQVRAKFDIDLAVFPVPSTDFRVQLAEGELQTLQRDLEQRVSAAAQTAMMDVWQRLFDKVKHIAEKCADPKSIFRDSMIENAKDLCAMLPRLNFTDDPELERMRQEVEGLLVHPEILRNDPDRRRDTAAEAQRIMDAMGVFMGQQSGGAQ